MLTSRRQRRRRVCLATVLALASAGASLAARPQPSRATHQQVADLVTRIETNAEQFRRSLVLTRDREWSVDWAKSRDIDHFVTGFVDATRRLRADFDRGQELTARVDDVLRRGVSIDSFMDHDGSVDQAARDWATVRRDLEALAEAFDVKWNRATTRLTTVRPGASTPFHAGQAAATRRT